jgi:broad-specificity NMP kinase
MKTLLTGIAGTGKSTIVGALNERGITAIDLHDVPDLFFWQDKRTKARVPYVPGRSREWFDNVDRLCDIGKLKEMLNQYSDIVMAGTTSGSNQKDFLSLFDKIILLQCDPQILIHRMQTRINKSGYGKTKAEQEDNTEWQKEFDPLLISLGAIPINTEGDLDGVVNKIIEIIKSA